MVELEKYIYRVSQLKSQKIIHMEEHEKRLKRHLQDLVIHGEGENIEHFKIVNIFFFVVTFC